MLLRYNCNMCVASEKAKRKHFQNNALQNSTFFRVGHDIEKDEADEEEMRSFSPSGQNGTQDGMVQGADNLSYQKEGSGKILRCLS